MEFTSDDARAHYDAVRDVLDGVVVGLDFDGTLSPVVDDPEAARLHPAAPGALLELAEAVRAVAVITGRPARQAIAMGDLDALGNAMLDRGAELFVFGQYGNERWSATEQRIRLAAAAGRTGELRARAAVRPAQRRRRRGLRRGEGPRGRGAHPPHGRPGRRLRAAGEADLRPRRAPPPHRSSPVATSSRCARVTCTRVTPCGPSSPSRRPPAVVFGGDDLGDVEAFEAVRSLRAEGLPGLVVCSASTERARPGAARRRGRRRTRRASWSS